MFRALNTQISKYMRFRPGVWFIKEFNNGTKQWAKSSPLSSSSASSRMMSSLSDPSQTAFSGSNATYMDLMYEQWKKDPTSVHASWQAYFATDSYDVPPTLMSSQPHTPAVPTQPATFLSVSQITDTIKVMQLARAFQFRGYKVANVDPLAMEQVEEPEELTPEFWGFSPHDLNRVVDTSFLKIGGLQQKTGMTLKNMVSRLREIYCSNIGYDYMHIPDPKVCDWIRSKIETRDLHKYSKEDKLKILDRMTWAEEFEKFLAVKQTTAKRFGLEGAESCIPGVKAAISTSAKFGVTEVVIGMPHRGRLNVLSTLLRKPMEQIFYDFNPGTYGHADESDVSGDVKYHLGFSHSRTEKDKAPIRLSLVPNPSHLEAVNPVVSGKVRAKQFYKGDTEGKTVMPILFHGDAAFAGQGVVYETMGLSQVEGFAQGGTFHLVVNNQVGFTTSPKNSRSMENCADLGKSLNCPIFNVNGDDPEAVSWVCELAAEYRAKFHADVIVDLVCYRRHGHNEIDEPMFTQPRMYKTIKKHPSTLELYRKKLLEEDNDITAEEIDAITNKVKTILEAKYTESQEYHPSETTYDHLDGHWASMSALYKDVKTPKGGETGLPSEHLKDIGRTISTIPDDFNLHQRIKGVYSKRKQSVDTGTEIDWALAESLSLGTLLVEGTHVRLTGEDVERGTFSHRHCVVTDQIDEHKFTPLNQLSDDQAFFSVHNSILSEYACLGFELGYSLENPNALVVWEAQFGDFVNGAQIIIDNFISSGEVKWLRQTGLVMLLPHGYEGQGPEHSSARIERFLQMCNDDPRKILTENPLQTANWNIVNCTTPANYFHVLRRQIIRPYRKALVIFTPKSLLRHPKAVSDMKDMGLGTKFLTVISDDSKLVKDNEKVTKLVACSGKVYYDIIERREKLGCENVAVIRIEQVFPFPYRKFQAEVQKYPNAKMVWCQEEPMNMGPWSFVEPRIKTAYQDLGKDPISCEPEYIGRDPAAATSSGKMPAHLYELDKFLTELFQ